MHGAKQHRNRMIGFKTRRDATSSTLKKFQTDEELYPVAPLPVVSEAGHRILRQNPQASSHHTFYEKELSTCLAGRDPFDQFD